jgi:hypothetical protein
VPAILRPTMATERAARSLTQGEMRLAQSVFGDAIDYSPVRIVRRSWWPFQPKQVAMSPTGNIHFHPQGNLWCEDFAAADLGLQALFVHEMTHVWQTQTRGRYYLPLMRHPFCRYDYALKPGQKFEHYGLEQQGELMRHAFLLREGAAVPGAPPLDQYLSVLPFRFARRT